jgi:hypothetical protein
LEKQKIIRVTMSRERALNICAIVIRMEESSQKKYDDIFITIINIVERQTHTHDMMEKYNFGVKPYIDQIEFFSWISSLVCYLGRF